LINPRIIFADFGEKTFSFVDPYGASFLAVQRMFARFIRLLETRHEYTSDIIPAVSNEDWTIKYLDHAKQTDNYNCGVLNFIENFVWKTPKVIEPHDYRKVLVADLLRIRESTAFMETSPDLPADYEGTVEVPMLEDSSGSEVNVTPHKRFARRLSSTSESSSESISFYKDHL